LGTDSMATTSPACQAGAGSVRAAALVERNERVVELRGRW
jgi:hypothetical protein